MERPTTADAEKPEFGITRSPATKSKAPARRLGGNTRRRPIETVRSRQRFDKPKEATRTPEHSAFLSMPGFQAIGAVVSMSRSS